MENRIDLQDLHKAFGAQTVLDGVSLTQAKGEILGLIGPSGAGEG